MESQAKRILSLYRYFMWCNTMKNYFYASIIEANIEKQKLKDQSLSFMVYWYAGLWVVVEGWFHLNELGVHDTQIDGLLKETDKTKILHDFRNNVLHYQSNTYGKRFINMLESGQQNVAWICNLHEGFIRFFNATMFERIEKDT